jgi:hypothetical protein
MDEMVRRFRLHQPEPAQLTGGAPDRLSLTRRFLTAVSRLDTAVLQSLLVSRAEFGWLIFPEHLYYRPPYELDPEVFWLQLQAQTSSDLKALLKRRGGQPLRLIGLDCMRDTLTGKGPTTRLWSPCTVRYAWRDTVRAEQLFGTIVERGGAAKFLSYRNGF